MFTGIVQSVGKVSSLQTTKGGNIIKIQNPKSQIPNPDTSEPEAHQPLADILLGESIAVQGVCLTVCKTLKDELEVYVSSRTLSTTNLSRLTSGSNVNLERALRIGDRIGGHLVQGHIDGVAKVVGRKMLNETATLSITPTIELMKYFILNGSVAIDGVSLTISAIKGNKLEITLIPYTLKHTTLYKLKIGDLVNIEVDILAKYLVRP
ncbi:MAG: riboflavin synthase [Candidatus Stahlbacteria bacterium]|nr:riboflavin synthase [Candidatus Stahlbacteria bacterium]